ncbi:MAG: SDR family NAD(P)-dependent oxidoreductase, partial [Alphaproteobacteria bacterium]
MNKTVIVTGAASGIGLACAKILLSRGARVTAVDPQVQRMRENLGSGQNLTILQGDVSSDSDCSATVTETEKTFGKIDGLIHCGAAHSSARWDELEAEEMNRILAIN